MNEYHIAWWNVENLFNVENSTTRPERLKKILAEELRGWDDTILNAKLEQLSKVISSMNNGGPDILGICEVEDGPVINKLVTKIKEKVLMPKYIIEIVNMRQFSRTILVSYLLLENLEGRKFQIIF